MLQRQMKEKMRSPVLLFDVTYLANISQKETNMIVSLALSAHTITNILMHFCINIV